MSSSAINQSVFQAKIGSVQNAADSSTVYSAGVWSFKNSTALTSVTITDAGNVGIGTASPSSKLHVLSASDDIARFSATAPYMSFYNGATRIGYIRCTSGGALLLNAESANSTMTFYTGDNERMRIDASGNLLFNTTSAFDASDSSNTGSNIAAFSLARPLQVEASGGSAAAFKRKGGDGALIYFARGGVGIVGSISVTTTGSSFNPSSDERLKENIEPLSNALETVKKLQPRRYTWKVNGSSDDGFIAQELQQIPEFAHRVNEIGERDGEMYYGVDYMRFVTYLTAAVQELSAKNDALEARLAALEAK